MTPACSAELRNYLEIGMGVATRLSPGAEDVRIEVRCPFMRMKGCLPVVRRRAHVNCALNERRTLSEHSWFSLSERQRAGSDFIRLPSLRMVTATRRRIKISLFPPKEG